MIDDRPGTVAEIYARDTVFVGPGLAVFPDFHAASANFLSSSALVREVDGEMDYGLMRVSFGGGSILDFRVVRNYLRPRVGFWRRLGCFFRLCSLPVVDVPDVYKLAGCEYRWMLFGDGVDEFSREYLKTRIRSVPGRELFLREEVR